MALLWQWSGAVTATTAVVAVKTTAAAADVRLQYSLDPAFGTFQETAAQATDSAGGFVTKFSVSGLADGTQYYYRVVEGGAVQSPTGKFKTFPAPNVPATFTVGFASCANTGSNHAVFGHIDARDPLLFVHTGDLHYRDISTNNIALFRTGYDDSVGRAAQNPLFRNRSVVYVWDDHDFGPNNSDKTSASRPAATAAYRENVPHHALPSTNGAIFQSFVLGRARFILTDTRSERDPSTQADSVNKRMFSAEQLAWLQAEMLAAKAAKQFIVWANTIPWIAANSSTADHWGGYSFERQEVADFIAANALGPRIVMLSGDMHALACDSGVNNQWGGFPVLQAAALDATGSSKGGPYSGGAPIQGGGQFGLATITDDGSGAVSVYYEGISNDSVVLTQTSALAVEPYDPSAWATIATLGDVDAYSDTDVEAGVEYEYSLVAFNTEGDSEPSNVVSVTTNAIPEGSFTATATAASTFSGDKVGAGSFAQDATASATLTGDKRASGTFTAEATASATFAGSSEIVVIVDGSFTHTATASATLTGDKRAAGSFTHTATASSTYSGQKRSAGAFTHDATPASTFAGAKRTDGSFSHTATASSTFTGTAQVVVIREGGFTHSATAASTFAGNKRAAVSFTATATGAATFTATKRTAGAFSHSATASATFSGTSEIVVVAEGSFSHSATASSTFGGQKSAAGTISQTATAAASFAGTKTAHGTANTSALAAFAVALQTTRSGAFAHTATASATFDGGARPPGRPGIPATITVRAYNEVTLSARPNNEITLKIVG
jgi:hypothetical protein